MPNDTLPRRVTRDHRQASRLGFPALALLAALLGPSAAFAENGGPPPAAATGWDWLDTLFEPLKSLSHWISSLFDHEEHFVEGELEHFKRVIDSDLSVFDDLVRRAGFRIASISVDASLIPRISVSLEFVRRVSEPEKAALMAKITDGSGGVDTIQRSIIMTLLSAAESTYAVRVDGYRLTGVDIDVDVTPNITFVMSKGP